MQLDALARSLPEARIPDGSGAEPSTAEQQQVHELLEMMQADLRGQDVQQDELAARLAALRQADPPAAASGAHVPSAHLGSAAGSAQGPARPPSRTGDTAAASGGGSAQGQIRQVCADQHEHKASRAGTHARQHRHEEAHGMARRLAALRDSAKLSHHHRAEQDAPAGSSSRAGHGDASLAHHCSAEAAGSQGSRPSSADRRGVVRRAWNALSHNSGKNGQQHCSASDMPHAPAAGDNLAAQHVAIQGALDEYS